MARGVVGTVRRHTKHNSPVPWTRGERDRQRISGYPHRRRKRQSGDSSHASLGRATEKLTSALLAYRDLAPIFMIRAVVKTWKTSLAKLDIFYPPNFPDF